MKTKIITFLICYIGLNSVFAQDGFPAIPFSSMRTDTSVQNLATSTAKSKLGIRYKWGGIDDRGYDCSGLVQFVYEDAFGIKLPRTSISQKDFTTTIDSGDMEPGDLVFFNTRGRPYSHVGIYLGGERFLHAPRTGSRVSIANFNDPYWQTKFNGARRVSQIYSLSTPSLIAFKGAAERGDLLRSYYKEILNENSNENHLDKISTHIHSTSVQNRRDRLADDYRDFRNEVDFSLQVSLPSLNK